MSKLEKEQRVALGLVAARLRPQRGAARRDSAVRATGLTFAPEAGTQRMRDVVNKNVTEEQLMETAERVFSRGWSRMKLYFMIGLPTEEDEDVRGIVETGAQARATSAASAEGPQRAEVTVSVSDARAQAAHAVSVVRAWTRSRDRAAQAALLQRRGARRPGVELSMHDSRRLVARGRARARRSPARATCIERA